MFGTSRKRRDSAEAAMYPHMLDYLAGNPHIWRLGTSDKMAFDYIPA